MLPRFFGFYASASASCFSSAFFSFAPCVFITNICGFHVLGCPYSTGFTFGRPRHSTFVNFSSVLHPHLSISTALASIMPT